MALAPLMGRPAASTTRPVTVSPLVRTMTPSRLRFATTPFLR